MSDCEDSLMGDFEDDDSIGDLSEGVAGVDDEDPDEVDSRPSSEGSGGAGSPDVLTEGSALRCGTPPRLVDCGHSAGVVSKFERVRVLGVRAAQLAHMAPSVLGEVAHTDPLLIAQAEFEARRLPLTVHRRHPGLGTEIWPAKDMMWTDEMVAQAFDADEWERHSHAPAAMDTA